MGSTLFPRTRMRFLARRRRQACALGIAVRLAADPRADHAARRRSDQPRRSLRDGLPRRTPGASAANHTSEIIAAFRTPA
jgi:hypothetical protein